MIVMKRILFTFLFSFSLLSCASVAATTPSPEFAKWAAIQTPSTGATEIFGTFQAGCITGAKPLALEAPGHFVVKRWRNRSHGHPVMISYLNNISQKLVENKYPTMIVEDIGYPRGGPFLNGHNSHNIGLDVDISLRSVVQLPTPEESDAWVSPSYVDDRKFIKANWGPDQIHLTEVAANAPEVNRIFVAPAIKKYFCEKNPTAPWLYKLRAWWGHDDHLHVRLSCPADSPNCKNQAALDSNDNGCNSADFIWWFSAEADKEWEKMQRPDPNPQPRPFPTLPAQCEAVMTAP